jgi:acyl carrier protein
MTDTIFEKIKLLVEKHMGSYKKPLLPDTSLEKDLGMIGDDAVEFLNVFSKEFDVDLSKFKIEKYSYSEGDSILPAIIRFLTGKKNPKQRELTLGDLEKAVVAGRLDEEIIGS